MELDERRDRTSGVTAPALMGCDRPLAEAPAAEVLARIPWDGVNADPERMTAEQFLGTLM